ncbi:MAG: DMT family transporter [Bacteroidota bacterium]|nr:DMT family transporter [Bacteroidota bacterium]
MKQQQKAYIYALSAILLWSTIGTAFKIALRYLDPFQLIFFASGVGLFIFFIIELLSGRGRQLLIISRKEFLKSALGGFLNPFLYYVILLSAYRLLEAQLAQPLNYLWPAMLVLFSAPLLGERITFQSILSVILGIAGVYVIASKGQWIIVNSEDTLGVILAAGSSVIWALAWILNKKDRRREAKKLFWNFVFGFIYLGVAVAWFSNFELNRAEQYYSILYVGFFEVGITFFLWMRALQLTESSAGISHFVFLSPFLALIFIHYILGEELYYTTYIGVFFIAGSILTGQLKRRQNKKN